MRVTDNSNSEIVRDSIRRGKERMDSLQFQAATLKKVNQPSDDPIAVSKILELRTDKVNNDQYQMNGKLAEAFLSNTDQALADLSEVIARAKEIAINQSSAASSSLETRAGVAEEVSQLYSQAVSVGNRRVGERYLFGGYKTQQPPVDPEGQYLGDDGQMMAEIANNVFISMNVPGLEVFNTQSKVAQSRQGIYSPEVNGDGAAGQLDNVNVFNELQNFRIGLLTGDMEVIRSTLDRFDQLFNNIVSVRSKVGSRIQGIQSTNQSIEHQNVTNSTLSSSLEDADMAQVVSDLSKEETVFRSSLASSKRLLQPTLLDFLR